MRPSLLESAEDLLLNESFLNFYFKKNDADILEWQEFLEDNPIYVSTATQASELLNKLSIKWSESQIREKYLQVELRQTSVFSWSKYVKITFAAASIILISVFTFQYLQSPISHIYVNHVEGKGLIEQVNTTEKPLLVLLSDGSSILLSKNARLSYPSSFSGNKREVYLDGEAFFEVAKKPEMPFFVYANEIVTKVIGTSFRITAIKGEKNINVIVKTGKVSVYRLKQVNVTPLKVEVKGVVITENQQIVFEKKQETFVKSLVSQPQIITKNANFSFNYYDTPANVIFEELQQAYGVQFIYDKGLFKDCAVTAALADEPLKEKLSLICQAIEATFEIIDGQIVIQGVGCK